MLCRCLQFGPFSVLIGCAADGGCGGCDGGGDGGERKGVVAGPERRQLEDHMVPTLQGQVVGFCVFGIGFVYWNIIPATRNSPICSTHRIYLN